MKLRFLVLASVLLVPCASSAAFYFVAPGGSDSNPGSSDLPFATAAKGTSVLTAGDTLTLRPGVYRETTFVLAAGTEEAPIIVQAEPGAVFESPDPTGHAEAINVGSNARYVRLLGIDASGGYGEAILVRAGAQNIEISDCRLHGNRVGLTIGSASEITVSRCSLYENVRAGLRLTGATHDVTIVDTDAFNNSDGLGCSGEGDGFVSDDPQVTNVSFVRTRSFDNSEDAYDVRGSNLVFDRIVSRSSCNGFKIGNSASLSNSLVTGGRAGIEVTAIAEGVTYNITNCTVAGSDFPIILGAPVLPARSYVVNLFNNIVVGPNRALDYHYAVQLFEGYNIFWNGNVNANLIKVLPSAALYSGAAVNSGAYRTATGHGEESLAIDPLFRDAALGDYTPDDASAAVDRADPEHAPALDISGATRPSGNGFDIGAIETGAAAGNHRPQADAGALRTRALRAGRLTQFDASASFDVDGDTLSYSWDFGDGTGAKLRRPFHIYTLAGEYVATLTVSDGQLTSNDSVRVSVFGAVRSPTPTRTPDPSAPTPTPTSALFPPSSALMTAVVPGSLARGSQGLISVRYGLLADTSTLAIDLPPELEVVRIVPSGYDLIGNRVVWPGTPYPRGSFKVRVRARLDATPGALLSTSVTLTEGNGAVAAYSGTTLVK